MTRVIRSRRAGVSHDQPLYARVLRLRHMAPNGFLCFVFLEGAVALGALLALAELVSWWGVLVLPATVAGMVKLNDVIAGMLARPAPPVRPMPLISPAGRTPGSAAPAERTPGSAARAGRTPPSAAPGSIGAPTLRPAAAQPDPAGDDDRSLRGARTVDLHQRMAGGSLPAGPGEGDAVNGPPASPQWANRAEAFQQMARQSATRRYE